MFKITDLDIAIFGEFSMMMESHLAQKILNYYVTPRNQLDDVVEKIFTNCKYVIFINYILEEFDEMGKCVTSKKIERHRNISITEPYAPLQNLSYLEDINNDDFEREFEKWIQTIDELME